MVQVRIRDLRIELTTRNRKSRNATTKKKIETSYSQPTDWWNSGLLLLG